MKNILKVYKNKVLANPNLRGAKKANIILACASAVGLYYAVSGAVGGSILCSVLAVFLGIFAIDGVASAILQGKEIKAREKNEK